jgi:hypothetical protein
MCHPQAVAALRKAGDEIVPAVTCQPRDLAASICAGSTPLVITGA